jgi:hypothetical protein
MGRNPILELDVNIFWSFSKYVLKMITITSDSTWSKYPGLWCQTVWFKEVFGCTGHKEDGRVCKSSTKAWLCP